MTTAIEGRWDDERPAETEGRVRQVLVMMNAASPAAEGARAQMLTQITRA